MNEPESVKFYKAIQFPIVFVSLIILIHVIQTVFLMDFGYYGVYPRSFSGLIGILTAPLIHADLPHLMSNSVPMLMLTGAIFYFYPKVATRSFLMIYFLTGLAVWCFARSVYHIGASGVVYGLVAFVFWNGIFRRSLQSIILALIAVILYSGMFMGILPDQEGISWESHLYGGFTGIFTSFFYKEELEEDEIVKDPYADEDEDGDRPYLLERDVFEKTKQQREFERQQSELGDWTSTDTFE